MKILKSSQVKDVDSFTIEKEPILSINLMERAAGQCSNWIKVRFDPAYKVNIFIGPGNNGGDGLAVARQLSECGYDVYVFLVKISDKLSKDSQVNFDRLKSLGKVDIITVEAADDLPVVSKGHLVIDGLFGSGLSRPLEGLPAEVVKYLNSLDAVRIAIDIPSGLFGEDNSENVKENIFKADYTLAFQFPSLSFFYPENEDFVGEWFVLPIGLSREKIDQVDSPFYMVTKNFVKRNLKQRKRFAHKGKFGHVLMICGGYGKMGASVLASKAALKTGSGLVTAHVPRLGYDIMQTAVPEAMMSIDSSDTIFSHVPELRSFSAVGAGPGLGLKSATREALKDVLQNAGLPVVLDADALNIMSEEREFLDLLPKNSILTPHPKEFERLAGKVSDHYARIQLQREFAQKYEVFLVLKGGNTTIATPDGLCYFNVTGDAGMATAGSGDVLSGMITSLLGQGYTPELAAVIGVYIHGLSGNIASEQLSMEAVIASDIIQYIGNAFKCIRDEKF
ncbi:MAG: NAD(P)H-hydrate dehydratase [Bacteroidota bacterium]